MAKHRRRELGSASTTVYPLTPEAPKQRKKIALPAPGPSPLALTKDIVQQRRRKEAGRNVSTILAPQIAAGTMTQGQAESLLPRAAQREYEYLRSSPLAPSPALEQLNRVTPAPAREFSTPEERQAYVGAGGQVDYTGYAVPPSATGITPAAAGGTYVAPGSNLDITQTRAPLTPEGGIEQQRRDINAARMRGTNVAAIQDERARQERADLMQAEQQDIQRLAIVSGQKGVTGGLDPRIQFDRMSSTERKSVMGQIDQYDKFIDRRVSQIDKIDDELEPGVMSGIELPESELSDTRRKTLTKRRETLDLEVKMWQQRRKQYVHAIGLDQTPTASPPETIQTDPPLSESPLDVNEQALADVGAPSPDAPTGGVGSRLWDSFARIRDIAGFGPPEKTPSTPRDIQPARLEPPIGPPTILNPEAPPAAPPSPTDRNLGDEGLGAGGAPIQPSAIDARAARDMAMASPEGQRLKEQIRGATRLGHEGRLRNLKLTLQDLIRQYQK